MKVVLNLVQRGFLTARHAAIADRFARHPQAFRLGPTMYGIAVDMILHNKPIEVMEAERGWSHRSAKTILRVILDSMDETGIVDFRPKPANATTAEEELAFVTGMQVQDHVPLMLRFGLSRMEARALLIMMNARMKIVGKEYLHAAMYSDMAGGEMPDLKITDIYVCKLRKKLSWSGYSIQTVWKEGWILHKPDRAVRSA